MINNKRLLYAIATLTVLMGVAATALWSDTGGRVSYVVEVPPSIPYVVPFIVDFGTLHRGDSAVVDTMLVLNTTNVGEGSVYTFRFVNISTLSETFSRFNMTFFFETYLSPYILYYNETSMATCFTVYLTPENHNIYVTITYLVSDEAVNTTVDSLSILVIEQGDNC